ncbi:class I SAM-dependent DNA methyltransferase, partial [Candidatus Woesearchaeota archaeon]
TYMQYLNQTLSILIGDLIRIPFVALSDKYTIRLERSMKSLIGGAKKDWDAFETSWGFTALPLLETENRQKTLAQSYAILRQRWVENTLEMQRLEEENNRIFIEAYGLGEELTPDVPLSEITLTCNPHYRYKDTKRKTYTEEELESLLLEDTMKEFLSYAVRCMFGRYSLDKPGLVLANQGEDIEDYLTIIASEAWQSPPLSVEIASSEEHPPRNNEVSFMPDDDNVIPIIGGGWFPDDIAERFKKFLKITFGEENYEENLRFIENALGKDIEQYFVKHFYNDHLKTYKKRPVYWLFSSPKGSFQALVYLHRYRPDTVSVVLNGYLRPYRKKLASRRSQLENLSLKGSARERTRALKEIGKIDKILLELKDYEDKVLYPLAGKQIAIDLDDGVKANYPKFGKALKKVVGLS